MVQELTGILFAAQFGTTGKRFEKETDDANWIGCRPTSRVVGVSLYNG